MPINFRKSIKLAPGLRFNVGKTGVGLSATIPGTGVSVSTRRRGGARSNARSAGTAVRVAAISAPQSEATGTEPGRSNLPDWLLYALAVFLSPAAAWLARGWQHGVANALLWVLGFVAGPNFGSLLIIAAIAHALWAVWSRSRAVPE